MNIVELKKKIDAFAFGRSISLTIDLGTVYVLLLKKDKLYVGFTLNPERKINAHLKPSLMYKNPHINTWIGMNSYPAKTLISKFDQVDKSFENDYIYGDWIWDKFLLCNSCYHCGEIFYFKTRL